MLEGHRLFRAPAAVRQASDADLARQSVRDYSQAMAVALGFYLFGHLADLATTLGFLGFGMPECNPLPASILAHGGTPALVALKLVGALGTAWVLWRLRRRAFTVVFTCILAVLLIYVASINSLDVLQALAQAAH